MEHKDVKDINALTADDWQHLYSEKGMTLTELARMFSVTAKTISSRLEKFDISRRREGRKSPIDLSSQRDVIVDFFTNKKKSVNYVSNFLGVSGPRLRNFMRREGIKTPLTPREVLTKDFLEEKINSGIKPPQIAEEVGCSVPLVYRYLYKFEIYPSPLKISKRHRDKIVSMYKEGKTTTEIGTAFDISANKITICLEQSGQYLRKSNSYRQKVDIDQAVVMYKSGKSLAEIVDFFGGGSKSLLANKLREVGVKVRSKSEAMSGKSNHMYGGLHSFATKEKMSAAFLNGVKPLPEGPRGNSEIVSTPLQGNVEVKSSWEAAVARYLTERGVKFLYEVPFLRVNIDGRNRSYTPDFCLVSHIEEFGTYIEVKGLWTAEAKEKVSAAVEVGYDIRVWDGAVLKSMGILDSSFRPAI